ncbi:MAG TPA: hypothetical protein VFF65_03350 [Phycisphaerales bacterium]|nr:hypothetical protein [Phycisphaerales bacterium]
MLITAAAGTIVWREMLGGTVDLARRDFRAQRAALIESLQPPAGRDPGASNAFDELARWKIKNDRLKAALAAEWGARDESWPGLSVPLRAGHPARTEENRLHLAALDAAAERYYADAVAAGAMEAADAVAAAPRRSRPARASAWDLEPDALLTKEVRELARLVRIRMIDAAGRRDQAEYRRCCVRIAGLAGAFASQHTVVDRLVAVAALSLAVEGVREDLGTGAIEATLAADCVGDARRAYAAWPSWSVPFQGEAIDVQQLLAERSVYIGTGELALIRSTYEELARAATMARPHRRSILDRLNADIDNAPVRWTRVQLFLPPLHKVLQAKEQIESELSGLEAMAAVERYRADKGVTPPNLAELVPQYLSEVPADAFSDVVKYRRFEARDAMGRDYLVYSAGYDGVDNNGTVGDEWSKALRRGPVGRGLDLPLNRLGEP